MINSTSL